MVRTKVFVGNLSFTTKENELAKEFEAAGKVISANIITRGPRSLGYGFVEMDNESDAENAVKLLDKKEIDGRPINVEVAKPREEGAVDAQTGATGAPRRAPRRTGRRNSQSNTNGNQGAQQFNGSQPQQQGQGQGQGRRQSRRRESDEDDQQAQGQRSGNARRRPARPARTEGEENRTPSKTTLFVANLPFSMEDDTFAKVLTDATLTHKTAHVVKKRTGRSKGFGFIEFDNETDQQKALTALNDKEVDGRKLVVKVALTELRTEDVTGATTGSAQASTSAPVKTSSPSTPNKSSTPATKTSSPAPTKTADNKPSTPKSDKK